MTKKPKNSEYHAILKKIESTLKKAGYTEDPWIMPQLKNTTLYHRLRKKMFEGSFPSTVAGLDDAYDKIKQKYDLLSVGFWSVYPVLFATVLYADLEKVGFKKYINQLNKDVYEFRPYTAKCIMRVTIWPKVEVHSHPKAYLLIVFPDGIIKESVSEISEKWKQLQDFEKFGILSPLLLDMKAKRIVTPLSRTRLTPYPPSLAELEKGIFNKK